MARSMWKGAISFGMVAIPIRLYLATESKSVSFRSLCPHCQQPIKSKRHCPEDGHELEWKSVLRGFEIAKERYVIVEDQDLGNLPLPTAHTIDILEFVPAEQIADDLYLKQAYYIEPQDVGVKPYYLLKRALEESGRVALGKVAFDHREHLATLRPHGRGVVMNTLNWPDEIRDQGELNLPEDEVKIDKRELAMARMLIENLSEDFDVSRHRDNYRHALMQVVEAKAQGADTAPLAVAEAPRVTDLMAALKASVEASRRGAPASEVNAPAADEAPPRRRRVAKAS
ncbi:MAG: non-homologous end joining protein Ku [Candidatus Dormibacteria bacterium]